MRRALAESRETVPQQAVVVTEPANRSGSKKKKKRTARKARKQRNPAPPVCGSTGGAAAFSDAEKEELKRAVFENPGRFNKLSKHGVNWNAIIRRCMAGDYSLLQRRVKPGTKVLTKLYVRMLCNGETTARVPPAEPASSSEDAGGV